MDEIDTSPEPEDNQTEPDARSWPAVIGVGAALTVVLYFTTPGLVVACVDRFLGITKFESLLMMIYTPVFALGDNVPVYKEFIKRSYDLILP